MMSTKGNKPESSLECMPQITAAELRHDLAALIARVQDEPVVLLYHRQCVGVMLSISEYQRLADASQSVG